MKNIIKRYILCIFVLLTATYLSASRTCQMERTAEGWKPIQKPSNSFLQTVLPEKEEQPVNTPLAQSMEDENSDTWDGWSFEENNDEED